jgi:hypothetical protein
MPTTPNDTPDKEGIPVRPANHDLLPGFQRVSLERLKLAADVILSEGEDIPDALTAELAIFRERVERDLLALPAPRQAGG